MSKKISIYLILFILISATSFSFCENIDTDYLIQTSLENGKTQDIEQLQFSYTIRTRTAENKLQYTQPTSVFINNQLVAPLGKNYYVHLKEGKNTISIHYTHNKILTTDTYYYYLDTTPPYINVDGIYNYMTSSSSHIIFSVKVGDNQSIPEALRLKITLNDKELKEVNGKYHGILAQSLPNFNAQKEKTNDQHPTDNIVTIEATDGLGHKTIKSYHIIYTPKDINYNQLRYLIEKVPGLISQSPLYDTLSRYSPVGVALDDSNITVLGTFGGYVVLGHDSPIYNLEGDDFVVNAHWSDQGIPLTSVMVMEDTNNNRIPDDTWYTIKDTFGENKEGKNYLIKYSFSEKGDYTTSKGGTVELNLQVPVSTPLPTPYLQMAKDINWKQFRPEYYLLQGNIKYMHQKPIKTVHLDTKGYNIDNAQNDRGDFVKLDKIDFIKIYSNTLDSMENIGSVMPAVNYVAPLKTAFKNLSYNTDNLIELNSESVTSGDLVYYSLKNDYSDIKQVLLKQTKPLVNRDYVFIYPEENLYDNLPYKLTDNQITLISPYNRSHLSVVSLAENADTESEIKGIIELYNNPSDIKEMKWVDLMTLKHTLSAYLNTDDITLTTAQRGSFELLKYDITHLLYSTIESSIGDASNSKDELLKLKWMTDFLSDEEFNALDNDSVRTLENKLIKLIDYELPTNIPISSDQKTYLLSAISNIAYTLSVEEYERGLQPNILLQQTPYPTTSSDLAFEISFMKKDNKMTKLYRQVQYEIKVPSEKSTFELYYMDHGNKINIPITYNAFASKIIFSTDYLGTFILSEK